MIGSFIMDQVLGMKWLNKLIAALLTAIGVDSVAAEAFENLTRFLKEKISEET